jgi:hypothetical protein
MTEPRLRVVPISFAEAAAFVVQFHRHHPAPRGHKFSMAVADEQGAVRGVATVGRPVSRHLDDGWTLEVNRVATDGAKNACSMLYGAAWRAAKALGYRKLITYTLASEPGTSLRAAGWKLVAETPGRSWDCTSRPRFDGHQLGLKLRWEAA